MEKGLATIFSSFFSARCFRSVDIWSIICHGECFEYIELHYHFLVIHRKKKVGRKGIETAKKILSVFRNERTSFKHRNLFNRNQICM